MNTAERIEASWIHLRRVLDLTDSAQTLVTEHLREAAHIGRLEGYRNGFAKADALSCSACGFTMTKGTDDEHRRDRVDLG